MLKKDLEEVKNFFPKLVYCTNKDLRCLKGKLDICDTKGQYWDSFEIAIEIPKNYPHGVPIVLELSDNIDRDDDRHISQEGFCCVDITHELLFQAKRGIKMIDFIKVQVYPYLANQLYFDSVGEYANGEYQHHFDGVKQFYKEKLGLTDPKIIIALLELIIDNKLSSRNSPCPCGGTKIKNCHENEVKFLKSVGKKQLQDDLRGFQRIILE